jgi:CTD small phosphatase-like protein 2
MINSLKGNSISRENQKIRNPEFLLSEDSDASTKIEKLSLYPYFVDKKTIIFDLDETLIHCNSDKSIAGDVVLPVTFEDGELMEVNQILDQFDRLQSISGLTHNMLFQLWRNISN